METMEEINHTSYRYIARAYRDTKRREHATSVDGEMCKLLLYLAIVYCSKRTYAGVGAIWGPP